MALGMSDFCAIGLIRKEIVHTFHFLTSERPPRYVHTCGTQKAHRSFFQKSYQMAVPGVCHMCAYNVPGVCTYFGVRIILKYRLFLFQRTHSRLYTTKTRLCNCIYIFSPFARKGTDFRTKKYASFKDLIFFWLET